MHIKFTKHGTGSAQKAANYLTQELDSKGIERTEVTVMRGDPHQVADVADSLMFKHKYTSGVIAFAPEEKPTEQELNEVLDRFEQVAFAGLEPDRYAFSAIKHGEEGGGCHIHVFVARCDLDTGRSMNIAPPGWEKTFDLVRDEFNHRKGWARPDDPLRARTVQPQHEAHKDTLTDKKSITGFLEARIAQGFINNRQDIIKALDEVGVPITRQGTEYISIKPDPTKRAIRLKGAIYDAKFQRSKLEGATTGADSSRHGRGSRVDEVAAQNARERLSERIRARSEYNKQRYQLPAKNVPEANTGRFKAHSERNRQTEQVISESMVKTVPDRPEPLSGYLSERLGCDYIPKPPDNDRKRRAAKLAAERERLAAANRRDQSPPLQQRSSALHHEQRQKPRGWLRDLRAASLEVSQRVREGYERARQSIIERIGVIERAIRRGDDRATAAGQQLTGAVEQVRDTANRADATLQHTSRDFAAGAEALKISRFLAPERVEDWKRNRDDQQEKPSNGPKMGM